MTKILTTAILLLLTLPQVVRAQQSAPAPRYLMVVCETNVSLTETMFPENAGSITVIQPDGTFVTEELSVFTDTFLKNTVEASIKTKAVVNPTTQKQRLLRYARNHIYQIELKKLNELSGQGWILVNTIHEGPTVRYLLQRPTSQP